MGNQSGLSFYQLSSTQTFAVQGSRLTIFCRCLSEQFCQRRPLAFLLTRSTPGCRYIQGLQHSQTSNPWGCVHQSQPVSNLPSIFHTLLSFFKKLSRDCQLHQKNLCWLRWLVGYNQVRLLLSESHVVGNSAPLRSANIIQQYLVGLPPFHITFEY